MKKNINTNCAYISMDIDSFELPPSGDILVLGKKCPIGANAAQKMLDYAAPNQFELVILENDDIIEAILYKKFITLRVDKEKIVSIIIEEAKKIMGDSCMLTIKCAIRLTVSHKI